MPKIAKSVSLVILASLSLCILAVLFGGCAKRPLGSESFIMKMEKKLDRILRPKKSGPKPKKNAKKDN
jgi:hypothetical protein